MDLPITKASALANLCVCPFVCLTIGLSAICLSVCLQENLFAGLSARVLVSLHVCVCIGIDLFDACESLSLAVSPVESKEGEGMRVHFSLLAGAQSASQAGSWFDDGSQTAYLRQPKPALNLGS